MEVSGGLYTTRTNLVPNPNFEVDTSNTQVYGSTLSRSTTEKMTGTASAAITVTTTGAYAQLGTPNASMPVSANTIYTWSAYVKAGTTARPIVVRVLFYDSVGTMITDTSSTQTVVSTTTWTRLSMTVTSPAGAVTAAARIATVNTATDTVAGEVFYTDGWLFEAAYGVLPYFDGTTPASENLVKTPSQAMSPAGLTHTTGVSYLGQIWTRATAPTGSGSTLTRQYVDLASLRQGETYTTAVTVANDNAYSVSIAFDWADVGNVSYTLAPGEQRRIVSRGSRPVYDSVYRFADLHITMDAAQTRSVLFKDWIVEVGSTTGDYYPTLNERTYSWSGTANASSSIQRSATLTGWAGATLGVPFQSLADPKVGTKVMGVDTKGQAGDGIYWQDVTVTPGKSYTASIWVKASSTLTSFYGYMRWKDDAQTIISDTGNNLAASLVVGSWVRLSTTSVAPTGATKLQLLWRTMNTHTPMTFYLDGALLLESGADTDYFDGSTPAAGDFTYTWAGSPHASVSYQQAPIVSNWTNRWFGSTGGAGALYQAKGGLSGNYARKLWTQGNTGAAMDVGITSGLTTAWANTTYTLSAWVRSSVAQNFNFYIEWRDAAGTTVLGATPTNVYTAVTANTWTRVSVTGTSPTGTATATFVLGPYAGALAMPAGSTIDFDNAMAEIYPSVRDYFDGATPIKNYCVNPSFDTDTSGWTASAMVAGHGRSSTRSYTGSHSLWGVATDNIGDSMYTNTVAYDVDAGATYTASAYVWVPAGVVAANFRDGSRNLWTVAANGTIPSLVRSVNIDFTKTNQWQRISVSIVIPTGSNKLTVRLYFPANSLGVYWDSVLVEKSENLNPYYEGQGGFTYGWLGAVNTSASVQQAPKAASIGAANQAVTYQIGTTGKYKNRISFNGTTIGDSGINFAPGITTGANKTYTVSVDITADSNRMVKFSAQGTGVVPQNSANISLTAGVTTRQIWSFSTSASGSIALYILRADSLLGNVDLDHMLIEEGTVQNGGYFDGTNTIKNMAVDNPNLDVDLIGWASNNSTTYPLTRSTVSPIRGTASAVATRSATSPDTIVASIYVNGMRPSTLTSFKVYPGQPLSFSMDVRSSAANRKAIAYIAFRDISGNSIGSYGTTETLLTNGVASRAGSSNVTVPANADSALFIMSVQSTDASIIPANETATFDGLLIENSATISPYYYEGTGDFTYAWTGTAHASTSVQRGVQVNRTSSQRAFAISTTRDGDKVVRVIPSGKGQGTFAAYTGNDVFIELIGQIQPLKTNTTYTVRATCVNEAALSSGAKFRFNIDGLDQYSPAQQTSVGEYSVTWQFTTGANATINFMRFMPGPSGVAGYTNEVILKNFMIVEGTYAGPYFDGATSAANDYTYRWTGTANDSTSELRATPPLKIGWLNAIPATSTDWSSSGTKSVKVSPSGASTDSFAYLTIPPLENGKTYTITATMRMTAPQTGTIDTRARRIDVFHSNGYTLGPQAPNVAGVSKVSCTFTVTDKNAYTNARLYNGASVGNGDVWYDDIMLVEGNYTGDFINPNQNPLAKWEGAVNDSASVGYPPQFLDIAGKPVKDTTSITTVPNTNPPADMSPRTMYVVYESYGYSSAYQTAGTYGLPATGRIVLQTQNSNQNMMGVRLDFPSGDTNRVLVLTGGRTNGTRSVVAVSVNPATGTASACINGSADTTTTLNGGLGWTGNDTHNLGSSSETKGIRLIIFHEEHDRATRLAVSRYLGNKYGSAVA